MQFMIAVKALAFAACTVLPSEHFFLEKHNHNASSLAVQRLHFFACCFDLLLLLLLACICALVSMSLCMLICLCGVF